MKVSVKALQQIIKMVEEKFPDKLPKKWCEPSELCVLVGQQNVVRYLYEILEKNEK